MPRVEASKPKKASVPRSFRNGLALEPGVAERELQAGVDSGVVISDRRVRKMDCADIDGHGSIAMSEDVGSDTNARAEVELRRVSRRNVDGCPDQAALREKERREFATGMNWQVPLQDYGLGAESV